MQTYLVLNRPATVAAFAPPQGIGRRTPSRSPDVGPMHIGEILPDVLAVIFARVDRRRRTASTKRRRGLAR